MAGVLGCDITLAALIWKTRPRFLVEVAWIHSVWLVVMYVGMLGLIYCGFRVRTEAPRVLGCNITLVASI